MKLNQRRQLAQVALFSLMALGTGTAFAQASLATPGLNQPSSQEGIKGNARGLSKAEYAAIQNSPGVGDTQEGLFARRKCIKSGGFWVTNSNGSFCWPANHAASILAARNAVPAPDSRAETTDDLTSAQKSWVWLERRRCVRSGGVFWESSGGTFCMMAL
jgi:hypothetical protein